MNPGSIYIHTRGRKTKEQKERAEMYRRLRKNPKDPEALKYLERKHISYLKLSKNEDGKGVEVRL